VAVLNRCGSNVVVVVVDVDVEVVRLVDVVVGV
jgi:hypothetical protein